MALSSLGAHGVRSFRAEAVLSGSMAPAVRPGSLVLIQAVPLGRYRVGDVISFRAPTGGQPIVTHRISRLYRTSGPLPVIETKGDANPNGDPWALSPADVRGKSVLVLPWLGRLLVWMRTPTGFLGCAFASLLLAVLPELLSAAQPLQRQLTS